MYQEITNSPINIIEFDFDKFKEDYEKNKNIHAKKITECKTKNTQFQKLYDDKQISLKSLKTEYEKAFIEMGFKTEKEYKSSILDSESLEETKEMIKKYTNECIETSTKIKELKQELKNKEKIDVSKDKEHLDKMLSKTDELKKIQMNLSNIYMTNEDVYKNLMKDSKEMIKQIELFKILEDLYKTASGTLFGKRRIEFEQYVQAAYFDMILIEANKRLVKMTSNRFELFRKKEASKLSDKIALDLEVKDNYTGKNRDVKSLSGGESFKAALALSLGLSDVIQSYSGGVAVDTLFIDEGFGSLDTESREQAINTLNMLTDNNKLIGIISHVTELKERIDKKIIVEKTVEGSKVRIEA